MGNQHAMLPTAFFLPSTEVSRAAKRLIHPEQTPSGNNGITATITIRVFHNWKIFLVKFSALQRAVEGWMRIDLKTSGSAWFPSRLR
jgi:hypothetical protein